MSDEILKTKEMKCPINITSKLLSQMFEPEPTPPDLSDLKGYRLRSARLKWYLSLTEEERGAIERNKELSLAIARETANTFLKLFGGEP
jgi:hypothetical protein